jgi:hypothetical protein
MAAIKIGIRRLEIKDLAGTTLWFDSEYCFQSNPSAGGSETRISADADGSQINAPFPN